MKKYVAFALALLFTSGVAIAQAQFGDLDANGDGNISPEEASADAALTEKFSAADANGDGMVSAEEYEAAK